MVRKKDHVERIREFIGIVPNEPKKRTKKRKKKT
jgi:hypothetical protein